MAGAGYKLFNTGDVLTAAQVNTYLQEQAVMVFADASARTTALSGVLAEGMITYLKSDDKIYKYTGSAWVEVGGSSSPLTTKGDLYTYSTADARLAVGTNGQYLKADSTAATGLSWATLPASGKLLQIVNATYSTETDNSTSTYTDTGLTASITPSATSSKILVMISIPVMKTAENANNTVGLRLIRAASTLTTWSEAGLTTSTAIRNTAIFGITYVDSPSSTSSLTYKLQFNNTANAARSRICSGGDLATITLLEIGA